MKENINKDFEVCEANFDAIRNNMRSVYNTLRGIAMRIDDDWMLCDVKRFGSAINDIEYRLDLLLINKNKD